LGGSRAASSFFRHFVASSCRRHRQPLREVTDDVMHALIESEWPGNVRELQHYIERAVVTTAGPMLGCPEIVRRTSPEGTADLRSVVQDAAREVERVKILQALSQSSGNRLQAAKILKISRASLYNKLREYGLSGRG